MKPESQSTSQPGNPSGGCAIGCASVFILFFLVWPALFVIGGTYEPDILFMPFIIGGPAFIVAHILAIVALFSKFEKTRNRGQKALWIMWGGVGLIILLALVGFLIDSIRGKT